MQNKMPEDIFRLKLGKDVVLSSDGNETTTDYGFAIGEFYRLYDEQELKKKMDPNVKRKIVRLWCKSEGEEQWYWVIDTYEVGTEGGEDCGCYLHSVGFKRTMKVSLPSHVHVLIEAQDTISCASFVSQKGV